MALLTRLQTISVAGQTAPPDAPARLREYTDDIIAASFLTGMKPAHGKS
jgi:hypothetical protein